MDLEFDRLPIRNRSGAAIISILSLAERLAISVLERGDIKRSFRSWGEVLNHIRSKTEPFRSSGQTRWLSEFLDPDPTALISLTNRNRQSVLRLKDAVGSVVTHYLRGDGALKAAINNSRGEPSASFFASIASSFSKLLNTDTFINLIALNEQEHFPENFLPNICRNLIGELPVPPHPIFRPLSLLDPLIIKSEFLGMIRPAMTGEQGRLAGGTFGLYAVVREARGWSAQRPEMTGLIVRDLLWLAPSAEVSRQTQVDRSIRAETIGFYCSAIDNDCLWISGIELQGHNAIVTGHTAQLEGQAQWMTLMFVASTYTHPLQVRDGILSGFAGGSRNLGAWKILLVKPNWDFTDQLEAIFCQLKPSDTTKILDICRSSGVICELFSEAQRQQDAAAEARQQSFLTLLNAEQTELPSINEYFERFLERQIEKVIAAANISLEEIINMIIDESEDAFAKSVNLLVEYLRKNRSLIEPSQIITFRQRSVTRHEAADVDRPTIENLLRLPLMSDRSLTLI